MKIQVFEVIKQGISLSFKDKTILGLIVLYLILGIVSSILMAPFMAELEKFMIELEKLNEAVYLPALPAFGINEWLTIFALTVVSIVILYAITKATFENLNKREISIFDTIVSTLKKLIPIFVASIIYSIIVVLGLIALVIPGIFLTVILFFYGHAILLNNKGITASFKESYNIVKGNRWRLFALYLIFIIVSILLGFLSGLFALILPPHLTNIIFMSVIYFISGVMMVIYTIVYFQLIEKEKKREEKIKSAEVVQEKR